MVECADVIEETQNRAQVHRMLAQVFFAPLTVEQVEQLAAVDWLTIGGGDESLLAEGCNDVNRALRRMNTGTRDELAADYTAVFYGTLTHEGRSAMPFASLFEGEEGQVMGLPRGRMYRALKNEGMRTAEGLDVPDDHLSFILELLAEQCDCAVACLKTFDVEGARGKFEAQRMLVEQEVLTWFPAFYELASQMVRTRFYRGMLKIACDFLSEEPAACAKSIASLSAAFDGREGLAIC